MDIRLFNTWQDRSLDYVISECRDLVEDVDFPTVKRWHEAGGKVLGHFQVYFPEELAHAAGMLPVKLRGAPIEAKNSDSQLGSPICSIIKTSLELALSGRLELDMFAVAPICDAAQNLAGVWGRHFEHPCRILSFPQKLNSSGPVESLRDEYVRLLADMEAVTGNKVTQVALKNSLAVFNENRRLLRRLYDIKRTQPWLVSAYETYLLACLGGLITREEHNDMLKAVIPLIEARAAKRHEKIRAVFKGGFCEQPPLDLIRSISQSCYIIEDDLLIGMRWLPEDIPSDGDALYNLAGACLKWAGHKPILHDVSEPAEKMLLQEITDLGAEAAIITSAKMCVPGPRERETYTRVLDEIGMPYFISEFKESMTNIKQVEIQLETFADNLLFD